MCSETNGLHSDRQSRGPRNKIDTRVHSVRACSSRAPLEGISRNLLLF